MLYYTRQDKDEAYRIITIEFDVVGEFRAFDSISQRINYSENQVIEIRETSGSRILVYAGTKRPCVYSCVGNQLNLSSNVPLNRLWIRRLDENGFFYKFPDGASIGNGGISVYIPAGATGVKLVGDQYFEKVYDIKLNA